MKRFDVTVSSQITITVEAEDESQVEELVRDRRYDSFIEEEWGESIEIDSIEEMDPDDADYNSVIIRSNGSVERN